MLTAQHGNRNWTDALAFTALSADRNWRGMSYLYARPGCTSLLELDIETAQLFSRADYYAPLGELTLQLQPLDDLVELHELSEVRHLKLDVQGYEEAVIAGATKLLFQQIVAVRSEVSFLPMYKGQPLFRDIDAALGRLGFCPMLLIELHEWRRRYKVQIAKTGEWCDALVARPDHPWRCALYEIARVSLTIILNLRVRSLTWH